LAREETCRGQDAGRMKIEGQESRQMQGQGARQMQKGEGDKSSLLFGVGGGFR